MLAGELNAMDGCEIIYAERGNIACALYGLQSLRDSKEARDLVSSLIPKVREGATTRQYTKAHLA